MAKRFCGNGFALVKAATRFSSSARTAIADIATAANHAATKPAASNPGLRRAFYQWQALVYPMTDNVHILRWGDSLLTGTGVKNGIVTHSDGLEVTDGNPARPGEALAMYAVGLGATIPAVQTGRLSPEPAARPVARFTLDFDYRPRALMRQPLTLEQTENAPVSVSLVPGYTGLYQVNFVVPEAPVDLSNCGGRLRSNLSVLIIGSSNIGADSYDQIGICVAPASPM